MQFVDARRGRRARENHVVSEPCIHSQDRLQPDRVDQVALVDAEDGLHASLVRADQQAIDKIRLERRIGGRRDNQGLVDVGGNDLLFPFCAAGQRRSPGIDPFDHAVLAIDRLELHHVAGNDGPAFGAAHRADESRARCTRSDAPTNRRRCNASRPTKARGPCDKSIHRRRGARQRRNFPGGDDRAMTGQIAFAADSFDARPIDGTRLIAACLASDISKSRPLLPILPQRNADLAGLLAGQ